MEAQAAFDAWLHTECGLSFQEAAQLTPQELARLQLGWVVRNRPSDDQTANSDTSSASRKRELEQGRRDARAEMYQDLGIH